MNSYKDVYLSIIRPPDKIVISLIKRYNNKKEVNYMIQFIQETALPKLSQTSLYEKFNETSDISNSVREELKHAKSYTVQPEKIQEIIAIMKLNGDPICKKAIEAYIKGDIGWDSLCEATYCYEDPDDDRGPSIASHLKLVEYLQRKSVI